MPPGKGTGGAAEAWGLVNMCTCSPVEVISLHRAHIHLCPQVSGTKAPTGKGKIRGSVYAGWVKRSLK